MGGVGGGGRGGNASASDARRQRRRQATQRPHFDRLDLLDQNPCIAHDGSARELPLPVLEEREAPAASLIVLRAIDLGSLRDRLRCGREQAEAVVVAPAKDVADAEARGRRGCMYVQASTQ